MSHDSFNVSEEVIARFEQETNIKLEFLKAGDAGAALNQAILSKENPLADVFFGVDNTFFSRAVKADIFEPYAAKGLQDVPGWLKLDPENRLLPVDYGDVCINYDKAWFQEQGLPVPQTLEDLVKPEYKGLLVVENPATSSPGLAFLLATIGHFGEESYLGFWKTLQNNDVLVTDGWEDAYYGQSTWAGGGTRPLVVSYASSPPAEVFFAEEPLEEAPTGSIIGRDTCFRQIEFIGILQGTQHLPEARELIDFMLSPAFQEDIPLQMFVFPANAQAQLPEVFVKYADIPQQPAQVSPEAIDTNREKWIEQWTQTVLR